MLWNSRLRNCRIHEAASTYENSSNSSVKPKQRWLGMRKKPKEQRNNWRKAAGRDSTVTERKRRCGPGLAGEKSPNQDEIDRLMQSHQHLEEEHEKKLKEKEEQHQQAIDGLLSEQKGRKRRLRKKHKKSNRFSCRSSRFKMLLKQPQSVHRAQRART